MSPHMDSHMENENEDVAKDVVKHNEIQPKLKYLEFVFMTQRQYNQLAEKVGITVLDKYVKRLNNYIGSTGKRYKSHYHTILGWINKDADQAVPAEGQRIKRPVFFLIQEYSVLKWDKQRMKEELIKKQYSEHEIEEGFYQNEKQKCILAPI